MKTWKNNRLRLVGHVLNIRSFDLKTPNDRHLKTNFISFSFYIYKDRDVAMIVTHPAFESKRIWNDVGVLFVQQDFEVTDHISPVCIPSNPDDDSEYMSENCVATGWGRNKYGKDLNGLIMLRFIHLIIDYHDI